MKKSIIFVLLLLILGSFVHAKTFRISIIIPDGFELNIDAPNYVSLGVSEISTRTIGVASSKDGPWFQVEVVDFSTRVNLSSLSHNAVGAITMHVARAETIDSVALWLVLCDVEDEALCLFIEESLEITEAHRETGEVTVLLSPGEY